MYFKKNIALPFLIFMGSAVWADDLPDGGKISGLIRTFYINKENKNPESDSHAVSTIGRLKYESLEWNGLKAGAAGYASDVILYENHGEPNSIFKEAESKPFSYLGEGYINYRSDDVAVRIGRQLIYTPLIVSSDIRRLPDTFEGATATYSGFEDTALFAGYVRRWTGYDSGGNISKFKRPAAESRGAAVVGITHTGIEDLEVQGWFYSLDKMTNILYAQSDYTVHFSEETQWDISTQVARFYEVSDTNQLPSGIDGTLYGVQTSFAAGAVTLIAAYNHVSNKEGKVVINGLGNGPYYTSREEWSLDGMEDGRAHCVSVDINMAPVGMEEWTLSTVYEVFKSVPANVKIEEREIIVTYAKDDRWSALISYVMINDTHDNAGNGGSDADYNRFMTRVSYSF